MVNLRLMLLVGLVAVLAVLVVHHVEMMDQMGTKPGHKREEDKAHEHGDGQASGTDVHTVHMIARNGEYHFKPHVVRIQPGDTVRWVLESGHHSTTAYHPSNDKPLRIPDGAAPWDSGVLDQSGATFTKSFSVEGVYDYFCIPHEAEGMVGTVVVGEAQGGKGLAEPQGTLPQAAQEKIIELNAMVHHEGEGDHHE